MNKNRLDYSRVAIETGLPIPSLRHKRKVKHRPFKRNSLVGLLSVLNVGQSVLIPIKRWQIKSLGVMVAQTQKRLPSVKFTVRNYFSVEDAYKGARVWRIV